MLLKNLGLSLFFILTAQSSFAQFYTGPIAEAMGGAGRAGSSPAESAFLNPATLAEIKSYYGGMSAGWGDHPIDGGLSQFSALLADGTPDKAFPGQFSYAQKRIALPTGLTTTQQDFQLGSAYAPLETFALGLSIHRLTYVDNQSRSNAQNNFTIGSLYSPAKSLSVAFVAYDLLGGDDSVAQAYQTVPTFAIGTQYFYESVFSFRADFVRPDKFNDGQKINTQLGAETFFRNDFALRLGWQWREVQFEEKLATLGVGYKGPRLSLDYTFEKDLIASSGGRHFVDLWMPF
jgi:hypothetical protein